MSISMGTWIAMSVVLTSTLANAVSPAFAQETPILMVDDTARTVPFESENDPFIWL